MPVCDVKGWLILSPPEADRDFCLESVIGFEKSLFKDVCRNDYELGRKSEEVYLAYEKMPTPLGPS